ncbi:hypothetical protein D9M70_380140 [compost metagenome]
MLERPAQVRRGHGVVDDQRHAVVMRHARDRLDVDHVAERVAHRLDEHGLGALVDQIAEARRVAAVGEAGLDARLRQRVRQQVVGAAIQLARRNDVVAGLRDGLDRVGDRGHARGQRQRAHAALERGQALLEHVVGRVHDAAVDIARHLQVEQVGAVLRVVEGVGHRLVDGHRHGAGSRIGRVAAMDGQSFESHVLLWVVCRTCRAARRAARPCDGTSRPPHRPGRSGAMVTDGTPARQGSLLHLDMRPAPACRPHGQPTRRAARLRRRGPPAGWPVSSRPGARRP